MKKKYTPLLGRLLGWLLPGYAVLPLVIVVAFNFTVFIGIRVLMEGKVHYDFSCAIDSVIPFWSPIVIIYVLAFLQWILGYILIGRAGKDFCYTYCLGDLIAKFMCAICFLVIPTVMVRPVIHVTDFYTWLTNIIYTVDAPNNLFPSIHCLESWVCWRAISEMKSLPSWFRHGNLVMTLLVCASTVLLKQHVFVDIIAGIAVAEIGIQIAHRTDYGKKLFCNTDILY